MTPTGRDQKPLISKLGDYLTARGEKVKIYKIVSGKYGCFGEYPSGTIQVWDATGRLFSDRVSPGDITKPLEV